MVPPRHARQVFVRAAVPSLRISSRARLPLKAMVFASGEIDAHFVKNHRAFRRLALAPAMMASLIFSERRAPGRRFARPPPSGPPIGTQPRALHGKAGREARFAALFFQHRLISINDIWLGLAILSYSFLISCIAALMVGSIHAVIQEGERGGPRESCGIGSVMGRNQVGPWYPLGPKFSLRPRSLPA